MKPKPGIMFMLISALILGGTLVLLPHGAQAQPELEIRIGPPSSSVADHSHEHDVTVVSLERGQTQYLLGSNLEDSHRITLSRQQVEDALNGTTIIVQSEKNKGTGNTKAHQHRVTITLKVEEAESSGW